MNSIKILSIVCCIAGFLSCSKNEDPIATPPELPPYESIDIDFSKFQVQQKSAFLYEESEKPNTLTNWEYSSLVVGVWSTLLKGTMAVPTAAFYHAFSDKPIVAGENLWQWSYDIPGFTSKYTARLTALSNESDVIWKMYISKEGIDSFEEFLWFEGISSLQNAEGTWTLYHSPEFPDKTLQLDWKKSGEHITKIRYTYVRELNSKGEADSFYNSYLEYGEQNHSFDIYYKVHAYNAELADFQDILINWDSHVFNGQVKSSGFYNDETWHCWDDEGRNATCE